MHFDVIPQTWRTECIYFYIIPATGLQNVCIFIGRMHRNQFNQPGHDATSVRDQAGDPMCEIVMVSYMCVL